MAGMADNGGDHAGTRRADLDRTACLAGRQLFVYLRNLRLQGVDLVIGGDPVGCQLVLGVAQLAFEPEPAALKFLQL